jgi:hypothetical protein
MSKGLFMGAEAGRAVMRGEPPTSSFYWPSETERRVAIDRFTRLYGAAKIKFSDWPRLQYDFTTPDGTHVVSLSHSDHVCFTDAELNEQVFDHIRAFVSAGA